MKMFKNKDVEIILPTHEDVLNHLVDSIIKMKVFREDKEKIINDELIPRLKARGLDPGEYSEGIEKFRNDGWEGCLLWK